MNTGYFPLPLMVDGGEEVDGLTVKRSLLCGICPHSSCLKSERTIDIRICDEGVNYLWPTQTSLIRGIFVADYEPAAHGTRSATKRFKSNRRNAGEMVVKTAEVMKLVNGLTALAGDRKLAAEAVSEAAVRADIPSVSAEDWVRKLVAGNASALSRTMVHDILQFVATIFQNSDFVLNERYGDTTLALQRTMPSPVAMPPNLASQVWRKEKAIYYTAELLKGRLDAAYELASGGDPNAGRWTLASPHQMFIKLIRIYESLGEDEGVELRVTGKSVAKCWAPDRKFSLPFLAVIDNAVKYAPRNSTVTVDFFEDAADVVVTVRSIGPRILEEERELIFSPTFRGAAAKASGAHGAGLGLWQARRALEGWGTITVEQEVRPDESGGHPTSFVLKLSRDARRSAGR